MIRYDLLKYYRLLFEKGLAVSADFCDVSEFPPITAISYNSAEVESGALFICKGNHFKSAYLADAIAKGASAYIAEEEYKEGEGVPHIIVNDIRRALAEISNLFFNYPWQKLNLIGVTGTKGKSTICYFIKYILDEYYAASGEKSCGIISTIDTYDGFTLRESLNSTPESYELQMHYANAVKAGLSTVVTEVSSQALKYGRVHGTVFDTGVFINIGEDHISPIEHADFEDYFRSKLRLFSACRTACINLDCAESRRVLDAASVCEKVVTFSTRDPAADVYAYNIRKEGFHTLFSCKYDSCDEEFELSVPGLFNVDNAIAAIAALKDAGIPAEIIRRGLRKAKVSGRMELYQNVDREIVACVDYAHNALSFDTLYESVKAEFPERYIITVFGCPGDKALIRRRDLGLRAGEHSDFVYITAEDPGYEDPAAIAEEVAVYVKEGGSPYKIINDREEAIRVAITEAPKNSIVLITGKGNETRQKYGAKFIPCHSDSECAVTALRERDAVKCP